MMCFTFKTSTANWITDRQFMSVCTTTLPTLRWTNTSPGIVPMIWFGGRRLSEHPIQRSSGRCMFASREKKAGSFAEICAAHFRLFSSHSRNLVKGHPSRAALDSTISGLVVFDQIPERRANGRPCIHVALHHRAHVIRGVLEADVRRE